MRKRILIKFNTTTTGEAVINRKRLSCHDVYEENDYAEPHYNMDLHLHLSERKRAKVRLVTS